MPRSEVRDLSKNGRPKDIARPKDVPGAQSRRLTSRKSGNSTKAISLSRRLYTLKQNTLLVKSTNDFLNLNGLIHGGELNGKILD